MKNIRSEVEEIVKWYFYPRVEAKKKVNKHFEPIVTDLLNNILKNDKEIKEFTDKLLTLIKQVVEEVVGEDEFGDPEEYLTPKVDMEIQAQNKLRKEQRKKLKKLLK